MLVDDKWGYADKTGKLVIPAKFDRAEPFTHGLAQVSEDGQLQYLDVTGKVLWTSKGSPAPAAETAPSPPDRASR